jgi:4-hydroxybenzoate polyprenyltransferase
MRLLQLLLPIFSLFSTNAYLNPNIKPFIRDRQTKFLYNKNETGPTTPLSSRPLSSTHNLPNKINGLIQITRAKSVIPPVLLLCFSGGWLMNPSLTQPLSFYVATLDTLLIMSASMVINDIYDIEMDKINSPQRPLITGVITKNEAYFTTFLLLIVSEYLNIHFLPSNLQPIVHFSIAHILLYTPVFKKIIIFKNISCALLVCFSVIFSGLASSNIGLLLNKNFALLIILTNLIFTGSWTNEILLDIRDYEGDKQQSIQTLPTVFGKKVGWYSALLVISIGTTINSLELGYLFNNNVAIIFSLLHLPQIYYLFQIKNNFHRSSIVHYMNYTNKSLVALLLYIICLSRL